MLLHFHIEITLLDILPKYIDTRHLPFMKEDVSMIFIPLELCIKGKAKYSKNILWISNTQVILNPRLNYEIPGILMNYMQYHFDFQNHQLIAIHYITLITIRQKFLYIII